MDVGCSVDVITIECLQKLEYNKKDVELESTQPQEGGELWCRFSQVTGKQS